MSKNNKLINSLTEIARRNRNQNVMYASERVVPQIYAAVAIALHRKYGFGSKRIGEVFTESQKIQTEFSGRGEDMIKLCEEETGITVQNPNLEGTR